MENSLDLINKNPIPPSPFQSEYPYLVSTEAATAASQHSSHSTPPPPLFPPFLSLPSKKSISNPPIFLPDGPGGSGVLWGKENQDQNQKREGMKDKSGFKHVSSQPNPSLSLSLSLSLSPPKTKLLSPTSPIALCRPGNPPPPFHQGGRLVASSCSRFYMGLCFLLVTPPGGLPLARGLRRPPQSPNAWASLDLKARLVCGKRMPRKVLLACLVDHGKVTNFQRAYVWLAIHFSERVMYNSYYVLNKN